MTALKLDYAINRLRIAVLKRGLNKQGKTLTEPEIKLLLDGRTDKEAFHQALSVARPIRPPSFWGWVWRKN